MYSVFLDVLKQVWNLSDQDGDSMLSVREFCTALYLMERFREGRPLPPRLPPGIHLDDPRGPDGQMPGGPRPGYGGPNWQQQGSHSCSFNFLYDSRGQLYLLYLWNICTFSCACLGISLLQRLCTVCISNYLYL